MRKSSTTRTTLLEHRPLDQELRWVWRRRWFKPNVYPCPFQLVLDELDQLINPRTTIATTTTNQNAPFNRRRHGAESQQQESRVETPLWSLRRRAHRHPGDVLLGYGRSRLWSGWVGLRNKQATGTVNNKTTTSNEKNTVHLSSTHTRFCRQKEKLFFTINKYIQFCLVSTYNRN